MGAQLLDRGGILTGSFLIGAGVLLARNISRPLKTITDAAQSIAEGDILVAVPTADGRDEIWYPGARIQTDGANGSGSCGCYGKNRIGDLTTIVKRQSQEDVMAVALAKMIENLRTSTRLTQETAAITGAAATEILASVIEVAAGATETATAVNETALQSKRLNRRHIWLRREQTLSDTAQKALAGSRAGEKSVNLSIEGMDRIREQMEFIAESIVKLSEQSQAIGEIVSSVSDLAEAIEPPGRSASIEAARRESTEQRVRRRSAQGESRVWREFQTVNVPGPK